MTDEAKLPPADEGRLDLPVVPLVERLRRWPDLPGLSLDTDVMHEAAAEIERLQADSVLLAWVLAHPETCAEVLEEAAAGEGEPRALIEQRRDGLKQPNARLSRTQQRGKKHERRDTAGRCWGSARTVS